MTRAADPKDPPRTAEELYSCATATSNLGLPHGPGAGAQGVLAAAAWTEVHLGSDLRRLRSEWEQKKPNAQWIRAREQFVAGNREQRRRFAGKALVAKAAQYLSVLQALQGWPPALEKLTVYAALHGSEYPDADAYAVLRRWLESPQSPPGEHVRRVLWDYLGECLANANKALPEGMRGRTTRNPHGPDCKCGECEQRRMEERQRG